MDQNFAVAADAVKQVTDMFGIEIIGDRKRFCAAMGDLAPKLTKEKKVFFVALSEDVGKLYLRENEAVLSGNKTPAEVISRAVALVGEYLNTEKAEMVAYSLAYALGWNVDITVSTDGDGISSGSVIEDLFRRAENGDNDACFNLGECLYYGRGINKDARRAVEWYTRAAERGDCSSQKKLAACWHSGIGTEADLSKAAFWYKKAAEQGDYESQKALVMCFRVGGTNLEPDPERAAKYAERYGIEDEGGSEYETLIREAENGSAGAQYALGNAYFNGTGTAADRERAVMWYKRAADQNYPPAMFNLAYCCSNGTGTSVDKERAFELYQKAARIGDLDAANNLAMMYFSGDGVPQSYKLASDIWCRAAQSGHARAQYNYAECKFNGFGVQRNYTEAAMWYKKSAAQADPDAQYSFGWCSENGLGVSQNYIIAKQMYELSAMQGNIYAQKAIGFMYMNGVGDDKNYSRAVEWFNKAALRGDKEAAQMLVYCHKYGGFFIIKSESIARAIAEKYSIDYDSI